MLSTPYFANGILSVLAVRGSRVGGCEILLRIHSYNSFREKHISIDIMYFSASHDISATA